LTGLARKSAMLAGKTTPLGEAIELQEPGCQPRWFICSVWRDLRIRTQRLYKSTQNTKDMTSLYWFGPPESKTLHLVLDCIDADDLGRLVLRVRPCPPYIG
jgi:hypothetical protein